MYPISIVDNFFEDPDSVANLSKNLNYLSSPGGTWPGVRSDNLHLINWRLFDSICRKISHIFYPICENWTYQISFQRVMPFSENPYDKKNCGWIHKDKTNFGGVIFLTREPDNDTGVTIYKSKSGYFSMTSQEEQIKNRHFLGDTVDDDIFNQFYNTYHNQFEETIKIKNIYNRLVLFNSGTLHAVQTYGTKERLTIPFFNTNISNKLPPLYR